MRGAKYSGVCGGDNGLVLEVANLQCINLYFTFVSVFFDVPRAVSEIQPLNK